MSAPISAGEFRERLQTLLVRGGGSWPREPRDQHILLKSIVMRFDPARAYTEQEVNEELLAWREEIGQSVHDDHVKLRRYLVDAGYMTRDRAGRSYRVDAVRAAEQFEAEVEAVDPVAVVEDALRQAEARKQAFLRKQKDLRRQQSE
ncbi:MAG: DUF2087 domain-containing protein [Candidatus Promineifilaceae bacterium]|nr:DUF2087 domain-containing protein [Candidatus Promineifilaceae bacterium]